MKSILALFAMGMMVDTAMTQNDGNYRHCIPKYKPKIIPRGCKEFTFYGVTVVAINEKTAKKKCKKLSKHL